MSAKTLSVLAVVDYILNPEEHGEKGALTQVMQLVGSFGLSKSDLRASARQPARGVLQGAEGWKQRSGHGFVAVLFALLVVLLVAWLVAFRVALLVALLVAWLVAWLVALLVALRPR